MAQKKSTEKQPEQAKDEQTVKPVPDEAMTEYGMTVGAIVADRDSMYEELSTLKIWHAEATSKAAAAEQDLKKKYERLLIQSNRIEQLEQQFAAANADVEAEREKFRNRAVEMTHNLKNSPALQRLEDGSLRVMIVVPLDQAVPLESWAHDAGEDLASYVQKIVEDALITVVSS